MNKSFINFAIAGKHGTTYEKQTAYCLETQHFPDSPNHSNFPTARVKKNLREFSLEILVNF